MKELLKFENYFEKIKKGDFFVCAISQISHKNLNLVLCVMKILG